MNAVTVLYAGDPADADALPDDLSVVATPDVATAVEQFDASVDCVVSCYALSDGTGFDLFAAVREVAPDVPCVLWTDLSTALPPGPDQPIVDFVDRDADPGVLRDAVTTAVETRSHTAYPLPPDEDDRLDAVERVPTDALVEDGTFDRLAGLVADHVGAPVSFVGLLTAHELRFLACHGADWAPLDRQDALCTYTVLDGPLTVADVTEDPRFRSIDALADRDLRSYLGVPLVGDGHAIGTVCVCDHRPRQFTDDACAALQAFAAEASERLELRRRLQALAGDDAVDEAGEL